MAIQERSIVLFETVRVNEEMVVRIDIIIWAPSMFGAS